jgi:5-methylcytosine-specific restriction endonuclease McrA
MPYKAPTVTPRRGKVVELKREGQRNGSSRRWRAFRLWWLRHNPLCVFCPRGATEVDHITPLIQGGGEFDPENVRSVCDGCHDRLTGNLKATGRNEMPHEPTQPIAQAEAS